MTSVLPRLFKHFKVEGKPSTLISRLSRPTVSGLQRTTRVPVKRFVQSSPKEYNGLQSAAHHFKQQRHMPYFTEYLMWVVFGSEALHLIWLKIDMKEYKEKMKLKTKLLEEIIERVEKGQMIDDNLRDEIKMVLMNNNSSEQRHDEIDDEYLNSLIAASEQKETPVKKPISESKWVDVPQQGTDKKKPFFL
ncbi:hypothetical protein EDC94DRAFT_659802 [Helicostylum pulchrum]|uniref:Uncharacterized protein n=1 Tax=Helicostylum pulchrum TaxID=562976 RepID=A0ABP9Y535_9FUNG|nr:hypothetical protein EDC94DRAFT_659802 [Helicostylum pulchrum]